MPDMSVVNVTWTARGDEKDEQIAKLLPMCALQLRYVMAIFRASCTTCLAVK